LHLAFRLDDADLAIFSHKLFSQTFELQLWKIHECKTLAYDKRGASVTASNTLVSLHE
jgi:hypothetical protein